MEEKTLEKKAKRSAYNKKHYQEHKEEIRANYNAQTQYVRWVEVKKTLFRYKKKIGSINYDLLMDELSDLDKTKYG